MFWRELREALTTVALRPLLQEETKATNIPRASKRQVNPSLAMCQDSKGSTADDWRAGTLTASIELVHVTLVGACRLPLTT